MEEKETIEEGLQFLRTKAHPESFIDELQRHF